MKSVRALLVLVIASHGTIAQRNRTVATETLRGRPVAEVSSFLFGAGLSHKWMSFYFASEEPDGSVRPIQIAYAFYRSDQLPPESFWDYSKLYEIKVRRESGCDTKVKNLAYVENTTVNGKELPRSFVLRFAKGAPQDLLKDEAVLPCYVLWYGDYRQVAAQTIATTIEEPGTIDLESLFQRADSVALVTSSAETPKRTMSQSTKRRSCARLRVVKTEQSILARTWATDLAATTSFSFWMEKRL